MRYGHTSIKWHHAESDLTYLAFSPGKKEWLGEASEDFMWWYLKMNLEAASRSSFFLIRYNKWELCSCGDELHPTDLHRIGHDVNSCPFSATQNEAELTKSMLYPRIITLVGHGSY